MRTLATNTTEVCQPLIAHHWVALAPTEHEGEAATVPPRVSYCPPTERQMADRARDHLYT